MTSTETTEVEETTTGAPEGTEAGAESGQEGTETPEEGGRARAARERAQQAEERVAALEATLATYRTRDVEAMVGGPEGLANPADFWTVHADVAEFVADDGSIDRDAVAAALESLRTERPHWMTRRSPAPDRSQGSSARGGSTSRGASWSDVLKGGRR